MEMHKSGWGIVKLDHKCFKWSRQAISEGYDL